MIHAYGYHIDARGIETIQLMSSLYGDQVEIHDLASTSIEDHTPQDIVFAFGQRTLREIKNLKVKAILDFPDVPVLDMSFGDAEERKIAADRIKQLKTLTTSTITVEPAQPQKEVQPVHIKLETLPPVLDSNTILQMLQKALMKDEVKEWVGTTKEGKIIKLTVDKVDKEEKIDIHLTFAELYTLRLAAETFKLQELEIVYRPNKHTSPPRTTSSSPR